MGRFTREQRAAADAQLEHKLAALTKYKALAGDILEPGVPGPVARQATVGRIGAEDAVPNFEDFYELVGKREAPRFSTKSAQRSMAGFNDDFHASQDVPKDVPPDWFKKMTPREWRLAQMQANPNKDQPLFQKYKTNDYPDDRQLQQLETEDRLLADPSFPVDHPTKPATSPNLSQRAPTRKSVAMDPVEAVKRQKYASKLLTKRDDLEALAKRGSDPNAFEKGATVLGDPGTADSLRLLEEPMGPARSMLAKIKNDKIWRARNSMDRIAGRVLSGQGTGGGTKLEVDSVLKALGGVLRRIR